MFEKTIEFLLTNACVSIQYLVHRDMLNTPINDPMMQDMQAEILQQKTVRKYLLTQHPDGWLGNELHGGDGMDSITDILLRCGVEADSPYIQKAMKALLAPDVAGQYKPWMAAGDALDFDGRGGNKTMTAWILSMARVPEDTPVLADEISLSFSQLSGALEHKCIDDFTKKGTKFRYYKPCVKFPGENHKTAVKCDLTFAVLKACWPVIKN